MIKSVKTVMLRSGGPVMTIIGGDASNSRCIWFATDHTLQNETLPDDALIPAEPVQQMPADPNAPPVNSLDYQPDESPPSIGNLPGGRIP